MSEPITCVIADDHPAMLTAVAEVLIKSGVDVVGRASDGEDALAQIVAAQPRVALVDIRMPRLSGIEVATRAAQSTPDTAIIFYTAYGDRALLSEAIDAGVRGFVLKEAPLAEVVRAVELVASGRTYVDPVLAGVLSSSAATRSTARTRSGSGASLSTNPRAPTSSASESNARSP